MSQVKRHFTQPVTPEEVQEKLEEACCLYEEMDVAIHEAEDQLEKLRQQRKQAWTAFNRLLSIQSKVRAS